MKEKCQALRTSIIVAIMSFLICCLLWVPFPFPFPAYLISFLQTLFGGIMGSSFVTLLIYFTEYNTQKRLTLEKIWDMAFCINCQFGKITYLALIPSESVAIKYFEEELLKKHGVTDPKKGNESSTATKQQMVLNLTCLNQAIGSYITIAELNWNEFDSLWGAVEFLTGKRSFQKIYRSIYEPFKEKTQIIKKYLSWQLKLYFEGTNINTPAAFRHVLELQKYFFSVEHNKNGSGTLIYNDFYSDMDKAIEDFRVSLHKRMKPIYNDRLEVLLDYYPTTFE